MRFYKTGLIVLILAVGLSACGSIITAQGKKSGKKPRYQPTLATTSIAQMRSIPAFQRAARAYAEEDYGLAFQRWITLAEAGNVPAQSAIGLMYAAGQGVVRNDAEAVRFLQQAAAAGDPEAQHNLGFMYATGRGVEQDTDEAVKWYLEASKNGSKATHHNLHALFFAPKAWEPLDQPPPIDVEALARAGDASAQYVYAAQLMSGYGTRRNIKDAVTWYQRAAEQKHGPAQFSLGLLYMDGQGVEKNARTGIGWIQRAADQQYWPAVQWLEADNAE